MAASKKAVVVATPRKGAVGKRTGGWKKEMAEVAQDQAARAPATEGSFLSIRGKDFSFQGDSFGDGMRVVILDYVFENAWYDGPYREDDPSAPACYAVSPLDPEKNAGVTPAEGCPKPQADACMECERNAWGSDPKGGRGKDCKNGIKLAVISAEVGDGGLTADYVRKTTVATLRLPPKSAKGFKGMLRKVTEGLGYPLFSVTVKLGFDEGADYPIVTFDIDDELPDDRALGQALADASRAARKDLMQTFDPSNYKEPAARSSRARPKSGRTAPRAAKPDVTAKGGARRKF